MGKQLSKILRNIRNYDSDFVKLNQKIDEKENTIAELNEKLNKLFVRSESDENTIAELNEKLNKLFARIESDENTIIELSKSVSRVDGDEETIKKLSNKLDLLENNNDLQGEYIQKINKKLEKIDQLGIDLFETGEFNMLDKRTTSQAGEDSILAYIVAVLGIPFDECTYIDLGANHPKEMNNTYFFYSHGAKGILVEANPKLIPNLKFHRNRDVILNRCVDVKSGDFIEFYIMNIDGLSTPDVDSVEQILQKNHKLKVEEKARIETISVNDIIENYLGKEPTILSIDIEGKDMEILASIDFNKYRPMLVIVEMIEYSTKLTVGEKNREILKFMESHNYAEFAFTGINSIFIDKLKL